ncbi:MAG: virulence protein, partial [Clostridia bacterium]|nr:virulence protein [Clostridia bacterium]
MRTYEKNIENRKELVKRLEELTGLKAHYTFVPRCAYEIGAFTVEKNGSLTVAEEADESILETLIADGMIKTAEAEVQTNEASETAEEPETEED